MAYCPYCETNLSEFENYDDIYEWHECPNCHQSIWLDYHEYWNEDSYEEWGVWTFNKTN